LVRVVWKKSTEMGADLFTGNLSGPLFEKHGSELYGKDVNATRVSKRGESQIRNYNLDSFGGNESWRAEWHVLGLDPND